MKVTCIENQKKQRREKSRGRVKLNGNSSLLNDSSWSRKEAIVQREGGRNTSNKGSYSLIHRTLKPIIQLVLLFASLPDEYGHGRFSSKNKLT